MWIFNNRKLIRLTLSILLAVSFPLAAAGQEVSGKIEGKVTWRGEVTVNEAVSVPPGAVLTIAAGTVVTPAHPGAKIAVQGQLTALGTKNAPIRIAAPQGWQGIHFMESRGDNRLEFVHFERFETAISCLAASPQIRHARFSNGGTAVKLVRESQAVIEKNRFVGNDVGVDIQMKSAPALRGNTFTGHTNSAVTASNNSTGLIEGNTFKQNKQAIGIVRPYKDRIVDNRFVGNEVGVYCNQTQDTPVIAGNLFENNGVAMVNFAFSYPTVENNRFIGNDQALRNDQYGSPSVGHNLFRDNGTALYNYRKANPKVARNVFRSNDLIMFCDYSSYPQVDDNNFIDNKEAVKLGIYQSADWEKRSGSKKIILDQARARGSKNPLLPQAPTEFKDFVDVSGNWWGEDTARLEAAGAEGNLDIFYDRRDKATVTYEGFGPDSYTIDWVKFAPWLDSPVSEAGPEGGK